MSILITYPSALEYWMKYDMQEPLSVDNFYISNIPKGASTQNNIRIACQKLGLSLPIHVLVPDRNQRNRGASFICHTITDSLPEQSIIHLTEQIDIISPECCFLLAARELSIAELAVLATDFLGNYRLDKTKKYGITKRNPITDKEKLSSYLACAKTVKGIKKARIALNYAFFGSCSPMESKIAVVASLPCIYGGYGLPRAELNAYVSLSDEASKMLYRKVCSCDLVWSNHRFIVEYDSNLVHSSASQVRYDKRRSDALIMSGYTILHVTTDYFRNHNTIDTLFEIIRKSLGRRSNRPMLEKYKEIRFEVIKKMFLMLPKN